MPNELTTRIENLEYELSQLKDSYYKGNFAGSQSFIKPITLIAGLIQSGNFATGTSGWRMTAEGNLEASTGTFRGTITATVGTIGGFTIGDTTITGGTLVLDSTGTIKTASTGQRVEINTDTQIFYDSGAQVIKIGTADIGAGDTRAIQVALNANSLSGITITSSTDATLGIRMDSSSDVTFNALRIALTNTGTGNDGYCAYFENRGTNATSWGINMLQEGAGEAIRIFSSSTSDAIQVNVSGTTSGSGIEINGNTAGRTVPLLRLDDIATASSAPAIRIESAARTAFDLISTNADLGIIQLTGTTNSGDSLVGIRMNLANAGAGVEYAFEFAGSEYISGATGVSGLTGVIKVLTAADALVYIPCYSTAT